MPPPVIFSRCTSTKVTCLWAKIEQKWLASQKYEQIYTMEMSAWSSEMIVS